jgi:hypothetical protein
LWGPDLPYFIADPGVSSITTGGPAAPSEGDVMEGDTQGAGLVELTNATHGGRTP